MKKLFTLLFFAACFIQANGQNPYNWTYPFQINNFQPGSQLKGVKYTQTTIIPDLDTLPILPQFYKGVSMAGAICFLKSDSMLYRFTGYNWLPVGGGSGTTYTAGNGIKFNGSVIRWADSLSNSTYVFVPDELNFYSSGSSLYLQKSFFGNRVGMSGGVGSIVISDNITETRGVKLNANLLDSLYFRSDGLFPYSHKVNSGGPYRLAAMDSTTGALVTIPVPSGSSFDTTSLSNRINLKVNISDTAAMLLPYRHWTEGYLKAVDIAGKLNISDTAAMNTNFFVRAYRTPGIDSLYFVRNNGAIVALKDSTGGVGMTNPMTTTGDIIYSSDNSGTPARVGIGTTGQVLTVTGGLPTWGINTTGVLYIPSDKSYVGTTSGFGSNGTDGGTNANGHNIFIGDSSGNSIGAGTSHIAFGYRSLQSMVSETVSSIAIGSNALRLAAATGNVDLQRGSIAIGADALSSWVTFTGGGGGVGNIAIGVSALKLNNTGFGGNMAIGARSMEATTTGEKNTSIGSATLLTNTTGSNNTAIGYQAMTTHQMGIENTAIGSLTLTGSGTPNAEKNTAVGYGSMGAARSFSGTLNTAVGHNSLRNFTTGARNTVLGHTAGNGITTGSGNIDIAAWFGGGNVTTGNYNITIGDRPTVPSATGNNQLAVALGSINAIISDLSGANRRYTFNGTTTTVTTNTASVTFDITGTGGGFRKPSMTTGQQNAISSPANGIQIYNTTLSQPHYRDGTTWQSQVGMTFGTAAPATTPTAIGNFFLDTTNQKLYVAKGTSSSADWVILN